MKEHDCNEGKQRTAFKNQSTCKTYSTVLYESIYHTRLRYCKLLTNTNSISGFNVGNRNIKLADKSSELKATFLSLSFFLSAGAKHHMLQIMMNSLLDAVQRKDKERGTLLIGLLDDTPKFSLSNILCSSPPIREVWQQHNPDHSP